MLSLQVQTEESENTLSDNFYKDELKKRKIMIILNFMKGEDQIKKMKAFFELKSYMIF